MLQQPRFRANPSQYSNVLMNNDEVIIALRNLVSTPNKVWLRDRSIVILRPGTSGKLFVS